MAPVVRVLLERQLAEDQGRLAKVLRLPLCLRTAMLTEPRIRPLPTAGIRVNTAVPATAAATAAAATALGPQVSPALFILCRLPLLVRRLLLAPWVLLEPWIGAILVLVFCFTAT